MMRHIAWFEIRFWLRSWMLWIFLLVITVAILLATSTDHVTIGAALGNTFRNSPFNIQNFYTFIGLLTILMSAAFVNSAAARDFTYNTYQIVFATPLRRRDFLLGRFLGATLVSIIPMAGVSLGILLAKIMPWVDADRFGPVHWGAHLKGLLVVAAPNAFFMAAILFAIAVLVRNEIIPFVGALLLITGYAVGQSLLQDIRYEQIGALLDPFAIRTFAVATKYWTVAERNSQAAGFSGILMWNRLLWMGIGVACFLLAYMRFSFAEKKSRTRIADDVPNVKKPAAIDSVLRPTLHLDPAPWKKFLIASKVHFLGTAKSTFFIVIVLAALLNTVPSLFTDSSAGYGNQTLPVTYQVLEVIAGTFFGFSSSSSLTLREFSSGKTATTAWMRSRMQRPLRSGSFMPPAWWLWRPWYFCCRSSF